MEGIKRIGGNDNLEIYNGTLLSTKNTEKSDRFKTFCCALGQLSLSDNNSLEFIQDLVTYLKEENNSPANGVTRNGHERAYIVMTLPEEENLEKNLELAGFTHLTTIHRRNYAPEDSMLKMWIISW